MSLQTFNDFVARHMDGYRSIETMWGEVTTTSVALFTSPVSLFAGQRIGKIKTMPSLPSGVTSFIPTSMSAVSSTASVTAIVGKLIDLGSLSLATPTFTDGNQMPTVTELGLSVQVPSAIIAEVTTGLNATPGSITVTYVDQDGNSAETTTSHTLAASVPAKSMSIIQLNSGDHGALDITSATRTGGTTPSGVIQFWGIIPLCLMPMSGNTAGFVNCEDFISNGTNILKLSAGDEIGIFVLNTATKGILGAINFIGDN